MDKVQILTFQIPQLNGLRITGPIKLCIDNINEIIMKKETKCMY